MNTDWLDDIRANAVTCEALRPRMRKPTVTGTISEAACLYLRALVEKVQPKVCVEIGTFIGTSALVLSATGARVFTCDKDNDAFPGSDQISCFPKTSSTAMLTELHAMRVKVDLFFFDGRIQVDDLPLIAALSHGRTVYAFDDYEGHEKGVVNVNRLWPQVNRYRLIYPPSDWIGQGTMTIAVLQP